MTSNPLLIFGVMLFLGVAMNILRFWTFVQNMSVNRRARMSRINHQDSHLSFDERVAERMRELAREQPDPAVTPVPMVNPTPAPKGFGRRQA